MTIKIIGSLAMAAAISLFAGYGLNNSNSLSTSANITAQEAAINREHQLNASGFIDGQVNGQVDSQAGIDNSFQAGLEQQSNANEETSAQANTNVQTNASANLGLSF